VFEGFVVETVLELHDRVTEKLAAISELVERLNVQMDDINEKLAVFGRGNRILSVTNKLRAMNAELAATAERASAAGAAMDGAAFGAAGAAGVAAGGMGRGGGGKRRAIQENEKDFHVHGDAPVGPFHARFSAGANLVAGAGVAYGMYENSRLDDAIARILLTSQTPLGKNLTANGSYHDLRQIIESVAMKTGTRIGTVEEGALNVTRMMAGFPLAKREQVMRRVLSFGAMEHYLKPGVSMDDASGAMVGLMHMSGKYKPAQLNKLARIMMGISLVTPLNMKQTERASSYAVPILRAGMGMPPTQVMTLLAMMQRSGLINTKSGTWARSFFEGLIPGTLGSGLFDNSKQKRGLETLGLVDFMGNSQALNAHGKVDVMKAINLMKSHLAMVPQVDHIKILEQAFGKRGGQFASLLMTPQFKHQWPKVQKFIKHIESEDKMLKELYTGSEVQKTRVAREEMTIALMNLTTAIMGPLKGSLDNLNSGLSGFIKWEGAHHKTASMIGTGIASYLGLRALKWGAIKAGVSKGALGVLGDLGVAGIAGYTAGTIINRYAINPAVHALTGESSLGVWLAAHNAHGQFERGDNGQWQWMPDHKTPVEVHTHVHLDGREVARSVSRHASDHGGVLTGHSGIDVESLLMPPNVQAPSY